MLTGKTSNDHKAFLHKLGIFYIIAGEDSPGYAPLMDKLLTLFGTKALTLGGASALILKKIAVGG